MTEKNKPEEFIDPLEDYESPEFDDPVEQLLYESSAEEIQATPFTLVERTAPVGEVVHLMQQKGIACVLVEEQGKLVGVFSDRDIMNRVALEWENISEAPVDSVMNSEPVSIKTTDSAAAVLNVMAVSGYRHVPVVTSDGQISGIITPRRMNQFLRNSISG